MVGATLAVALAKLEALAVALINPAIQYNIRK